MNCCHRQDGCEQFCVSKCRRLCCLYSLLVFDFSDTNKRKKSKPIKKTVDNSNSPAAQVRMNAEAFLSTSNQVADTVDTTEQAAAAVETNIDSHTISQPVMLPVIQPAIEPDPKPNTSTSTTQSLQNKSNPDKIAMRYQPKRGSYKMKSLFTVAPQSSGTTGANQQTSAAGL